MPKYRYFQIILRFYTLSIYLCIIQFFFLILVRLHGGEETPSHASGWVEIYDDFYWHSACADFNQSFDERAVHVACQELGYNRGVQLPIQSNRVIYSSNFLERIRCNGTEKSVHDCDLTFGSITDCSDNLSRCVRYYECRDEVYIGCSKGDADLGKSTNL